MFLVMKLSLYMFWPMMAITGRHRTPHAIQMTYCEGTRPSLGFTARF
jgi:hypothetical protein